MQSSGATPEWFRASLRAKETAQLETVHGVGERCYGDVAQRYCRHLGRGYPTSQTWGERGERAVVPQRG